MGLRERFANSYTKLGWDTSFTKRTEHECHNQTRGTGSYFPTILKEMMEKAMS